jgi:hypothetical protein
MKLPPEEDRDMPKKYYETGICGLDLMKEEAPNKSKKADGGRLRSERFLRESP